MKNLVKTALIVLVLCVVTEVSSGGGGKKEKVHFKIQVPKFVNKHYHTKTVYIHVHEPPPKPHHHEHKHEHDHHHDGGHGHGHSYHHTHHTSTHHSHHDDHGGTHHTTHHKGGHDRSGPGGHHGHDHHKPPANPHHPHHHPPPPPHKPKAPPHHGHPHHVPHKPPPKKPAAKHPVHHPHHHHPHHHGHPKPKPHHPKPIPKPPTHKHPVIKPVHEYHPPPPTPPKKGHEHVVHKQNYEYNAEYNSDDYVHNPYYYQQIEAETPFYESVHESLEDNGDAEHEDGTHSGIYQDYSTSNHDEDLTTVYPEESHNSYQNNYENTIPAENEPGLLLNPYLSAYVHGTDGNQYTPNMYLNHEATTNGNVQPNDVTYDSYGNILSGSKKQNDPYSSNFIYPPLSTDVTPTKIFQPNFSGPTNDEVQKSEYDRYANAEKQIEQDFHIDAESLNHSIIYDSPPNRKLKKSNKKHRTDTRHGSRYRP